MLDRGPPEPSPWPPLLRRTPLKWGMVENHWVMEPVRTLPDVIPQGPAMAPIILTFFL